MAELVELGSEVRRIRSISFELNGFADSDIFAWAVELFHGVFDSSPLRVEDIGFRSNVNGNFHVNKISLLSGGEARVIWRNFGDSLYFYSFLFIDFLAVYVSIQFIV